MRSTLLIVLAAAGVHLAAAVPARADCTALDGAVKAAIAKGDIAALPGLADRISKESSCDGSYVEGARRSIALAFLSVGQKEDGSFSPEYVAGAAAIARPWQVSMALGDLKYDAKDYAAAAGAYEAAINEIRNVKLVPKAPPREVEDYLAKRAYQAKSLAPTYVASRGFRGEAAGVMVPTFRNFTAVAVPVPIRFATDEAVLTDDGLKAVDDLYNYLKGQRPKTVVLIGHTDERGSDAYNDKLSRARAEAVAAVLKQKGLDCAIDAEGHGKHEPFEADDRSKYSQDDLYAFDRRVEFKVVQ
ncbi:OmpA family protein [Labrys wisconsinensis]|uniref:Outer membrane protein OmpA-like peptidoglycan-associated protein n=1 Tax=Labrys wisconsinensis TaxID=425677 RepID=A0ABU0JE62_9HYPH|nr:OmpA family protein [Labrys wisconsinensis]MDQ0472567.1 outer membrane protein OmpA-like peptidoglycan-associated protein [Labrys wisconsinensis]